MRRHRRGPVQVVDHARPAFVARRSPGTARPGPRIRLDPLGDDLAGRSGSAPRSAARVADQPGGAADQAERLGGRPAGAGASISELHQVAEVQARRGRVEAAVEGDRPGGQRCRAARRGRWHPRSARATRGRRAGRIGRTGPSADEYTAGRPALGARREALRPPVLPFGPDGPPTSTSLPAARTRPRRPRPSGARTSRAAAWHRRRAGGPDGDLRGRRHRSVRGRDVGSLTSKHVTNQ